MLSEEDRKARDEVREAMIGINRQVLFWAVLDLADRDPGLARELLEKAGALYGEYFGAAEEAAGDARG